MAARLLLALVAALANEAAEARRHPAQLLQGLSQSGLARRGPLPGISKVGAVKADFVRKCTVTLSVGTKKLLPVDALDTFCRQTDAYVECRIKLVMRYESLYENGGDIAGFCADAYEWFRKKYGALCPLQCEKLQCRSTCAWLKEQKHVKEQGRELAAEKLEASELEGKLSDCVTALKAAEEEEQEQNRTVGSSEAQVLLAEEELAHCHQRAEEAKQEVTKVEQRVESLKETLSGYSSEVSAGEARLGELQHKLDEAHRTLDHLKEQHTTLDSSIKEENTALDSLKLKTKELKEVFQACNQTATDLADDAEAANVQAEDQKKVLQNAADLPKEQVDKERMKLEQFQYLAQKASDAAGKAKGKLKAARRKFRDARAKDRSQTDKVKGLLRKLQQVDTDSGAVLEKLKPAEAEQAALEKTLSRSKEDYLQVNRKLAHELEVLHEDTAVLDREVKREHRAERACAGAKAGLSKAQKALEKAGKAVKAKVAEEVGLQDRLKHVSSKVGKHMQAHIESQRMMKKLKPRIVGQRGFLRLLQPLLGL